MNKRLYLNLIGQLCTFGLTLGINFFLTPFIVSNLGQETYGFVGLANNFVNYITLFTIALNGMLSRYITVEYAKKNYREASGYLSTAIITQIVLAVALLIPMMLLASYVDKVVDISPEIVPDVRILWILVFLSFLINFSLSGLNVSTYARNRLDISAIISIVTNLLRSGILLVTFLFFTPHVWYMGLASIVCNTLYILMQIPLKRKLMPEVKIKRKYFNKKYIFKLLVVGIWNSLNKLQQILITGLDLLLTNVFISSIEMGLLSIAKTIPGIISTLIGTVSSTFEPQMTIVYGTGDMDKFVGETKFAMKFGGLLCSVPIIGFLCFGRAFYSLWMPSLSSTDVYKVHILAILTLLPEIFSVYIFPLYSVNTVTCKLKIPVLLSVAIGLLNILIVFILLKITNWGVYVVAGVSSVLWLLRIFLFVPGYAAWSLGVNWKTFYPPLIRGGVNNIVLIVIFTLINRTVNINSWIELVFVGLLAGIVGYIICFMMIFSKNERKVAMSRIANKISKNKFLSHNSKYNR